MNKIVIVVVITLVLNLLNIPVFSQEDEDVFPVVPVDSQTGLITYQDVVTEQGSASDFFNRAVNWVNKTYKNPTSVTSVRDPHSGIIEGNYRFRIYKTTIENTNIDWGTILYSFQLEFKEGRYRYTFTDFQLKQASRFPLERWLNIGDPVYNEECGEKLSRVDTYMKDFIQNLKDMMKPEIEVEEEEW